MEVRETRVLETMEEKEAMEANGKRELKELRSPGSIF